MSLALDTAPAVEVTEEPWFAAYQEATDIYRFARAFQDDLEDGMWDEMKEVGLA